MRIETNWVVKAMLTYKIINKKVVFISIKCLLYLVDQLGLDQRNLKCKPHTTWEAWILYEGASTKTEDLPPS